MSSLSLYGQFRKTIVDINALESALSLFHWDQQTYMPRLAAEGRAAQVATIAAIQHEKRNSPHLHDLVETLLGDSSLSPEQRDNVRLVRRELKIARALPAALVREIAAQSSRTHDLWLEARKQKSFALVRNDLANLISLKQEYSDVLLAVDHPTEIFSRPCISRYDILLDSYEPGMRSDRVRELFSELRSSLSVLVERIKLAQKPTLPAALSRGPFAHEAQQKFVCELVRDIGFDFEAGRIDETVHPFCSTIGLRDVRLCTRYHETNLFSGLFGALHEAGHGLYEQGLLEEYWALPLGEACSLGIHESQSLLWEKLIGRSAWFWRIYFPKLRQHFPDTLENVSEVDFFRFVNRVEPSFIRINADEVTYGLHIILRFELEEALICGDLPIGDLVAAWNEQYRQLLGITPDNDVDGVLQDTHWYSGLIGYFPTYSLGAMAAAQLFDCFRDTQGSANLENGDFKSLLQWLQIQVHRQGKRHNSEELIERITGSKLSAKSLLTYLKQKYGALYSL